MVSANQLANCLHFDKTHPSDGFSDIEDAERVVELRLCLDQVEEKSWRHRGLPLGPAKPNLRHFQIEPRVKRRALRIEVGGKEMRTVSPCRSRPGTELGNAD